MTTRKLTMTKSMLVLAAILILWPLHAALAAIDPQIQLYGRWDRRDADRAITVNSGSHIVARFEGAGASARFDVSKNKAPFPTLAWRIDDQPWQEAEVAATLELARGLEKGPHSLVLFVRDLDEHQPRWSPPLSASVTFLGLDLPEGKLLDPPAEPKLKIEFLGDSITEGVRVHNSEPGKTTWPWQGDGRVAYPTQTAERLGAQWRQCGFGRLGVLIPGNGGVPVAADSFNFFYQDCPRDAWQPDVVVINQGTNDGGARRSVSSLLMANCWTWCARPIRRQRSWRCVRSTVLTPRTLRPRSKPAATTAIRQSHSWTPQAGSEMEILPTESTPMCRGAERREKNWRLLCAKRREK